MAVSIPEFPLFPLGIVALPHELVPLHIFEERYKAMVEHCLETESEFGIVWLSDEQLAPVGCACEIAEVVQRAPDGRMHIVTRGTRPFEIVERQSHLPYPAGSVTFLDDAEEPSDPAAADAARTAYAELVEEVTDERPEPAELAAMDAYALASTIDFELDAKQELLALRSENARMRFVRDLLRTTLERLTQAERVRVRAQSNGRIRL